MTSPTPDQSSVLRAMQRLTVKDAPPYLDDLRRATGLGPEAFDRATAGLIDAGITMRASAPFGGLLYPTLRAWDSGEFQRWLDETEA